jgi:hypothetical protein
MQFVVVLLIVGGVTAVFFGVPASLEAGEKLINIWIGAGLLVVLLTPVFGIGRFFYHLLRAILGIFRRKSVR